MSDLNEQPRQPAGDGQLEPAQPAGQPAPASQEPDAPEDIAPDLFEITGAHQQLERKEQLKEALRQEYAQQQRLREFAQAAEQAANEVSPPQPQEQPQEPVPHSLWQQQPQEQAQQPQWQQQPQEQVPPPQWQQHPQEYLQQAQAQPPQPQPQWQPESDSPESDRPEADVPEVGEAPQSHSPAERFLNRNAQPAPKSPFAGMPPAVPIGIGVAALLVVAGGLWFFLRPSSHEQGNKQTVGQQGVQDGASFDELAKAAVTAYDNGKYEEAVAYLDRAEKLDPKNHDLIAQRGYIAVKANNYQKALDDYTKAIAIAPRFKYQFDHAYICYRLGKYEDAAKEYTAILADNSRPFVPVFNAKGPDLAATLKSAQEKNQRSFDALFGRALAYRQLGQTDKAAHDLKEANQIIPQNFEANLEMGNLQFAQYQYPQAIKSLNAALKNKPNSAQAYFLRASAFYRAGQVKKALPDYQKAIELDASAADYLNDFGYALWKVGRRQDAIANFNKALAIKPEHERAASNLSAAMQGGPAR